jgi:hypothetical protein
VLWLLPLACAIVGLIVLLRCAAAVRSESGPAVAGIDRFHRDVRAATVRVHDHTLRARRRDDR